MKGSILCVPSPCRSNCLHATWHTLVELFQIVSGGSSTNHMSIFSQPRLRSVSSVLRHFQSELGPSYCPASPGKTSCCFINSTSWLNRCNEPELFFHELHLLSTAMKEKVFFLSFVKVTILRFHL